MNKSLVNIWIHAVWGTKNRVEMIDTALEPKLIEIMYGHFKELNCRAKIINCMPEHVHCLFRLNSKVTVADAIKYVKGGTAHLINHENLTFDKFVWQQGYGAFSVSESQLKEVFNYIKNQKIIHKNRTFKEEMELYDSLILEREREIED